MAAPKDGQRRHLVLWASVQMCRLQAAEVGGISNNQVSVCALHRVSEGPCATGPQERTFQRLEEVAYFLVHILITP